MGFPCIKKPMYTYLVLTELTKLVEQTLSLPATGEKLKGVREQTQPQKCF